MEKHWYSIKNSSYLVKFKFYNRHETAQIEINYRQFKGGNCLIPYYNKPDEASNLIAWLDKEKQ